MMQTIEADYLVVGAGATGMAFTDALIADSDATVVLVDRRHQPGGHWNDAYPFVRLHTPSAIYGVNSMRLGNDRIDTTGPNAGFYERATGAEVAGYYQRVLDEVLLASGRVRFFGMHDYVPGGTTGHLLVSRLTGAETAVRVARNLVDATHLETSVPATHAPSFEIDRGATVVTPSELVRRSEASDGYTVLGAGKTAMDTCIWLLDHGVAPDDILWVRPRDAWILDRGFVQPLDLVPSLVEGVSLDLESAAAAEDVADLFARLEDCGQLHRLDPDIEPDMYHGAILSEAERNQLRRIERVVRKGRVRRVGADELVLDDGTIATGPGQVHIDCTAIGLRHAPPRPIFEHRCVTPQHVRQGMVPFNAALVGFIEATRDSDDDKNRLCPPNPLPRVDSALDWAWTTSVATRAEALWMNEPDIQAWLERSRLNVARGLGDHLDDPRMQTAVTRMMTHSDAAVGNLERLLADGETAAA